MRKGLVMDYQENETLPENESSAKPAKAITLKTWLAMGALAIVGQLAWAVENSWFNKFVTDMITPDPRPIAWMVAASAIVATLTTIFMGTWSDRSRSRWGILACAWKSWNSCWRC